MPIEPHEAIAERKTGSPTPPVRRRRENLPVPRAVRAEGKRRVACDGALGGAPRALLPEYVPRHIFGVLCPPRLCGLPHYEACLSAGRRLGTGHIMESSDRGRPSSPTGQRGGCRCWSGTSSVRRRSTGSEPRGSRSRSSSTSLGSPSGDVPLGRSVI